MSRKQKKGLLLNGLTGRKPNDTINLCEQESQVKSVHLVLVDFTRLKCTVGYIVHIRISWKSAPADNAAAAAKLEMMMSEGGYKPQ